MCAKRAKRLNTGSAELNKAGKAPALLTALFVLLHSSGFKFSTAFAGPPGINPSLGRLAASTGAKIIKLEGEVKIRRGLEESWERAQRGMLLQDIDTILTGENGEVELHFGENAIFKLGNNAVLDIADLRRITEQELFLILMSQKISRIKPSRGTAPGGGDVSAIRGSPFAGAPSSFSPESQVATSAWWRREVNAAQALAAQNLPTNAALKWHRIREKFPAQSDCGEVSFHLAQTLEQLRQSGQARDEYQASLQQAREQNCRDEGTERRKAIAEERLQHH